MTLDELNAIKNSSPMYTITPVIEPISLRDYFAGQALAGFCGNPDLDLTTERTDAPEKVGLILSKWSYGIADAMIAEREKK